MHGVGVCVLDCLHTAIDIVSSSFGAAGELFLGVGCGQLSLLSPSPLSHPPGVFWAPAAPSTESQVALQATTLYSLDSSGAELSN
jgi:hypothetical protein